MNRWALLAAVLTLLASWTAEADRTKPIWRVVCDHNLTAAEPICHIALFSQDKASGTWLGVAVQILNGSPEVQVTSSGADYRSAEIDGSVEVTTYTDYCFGSYCIFLHAVSLVDQFKAGERVAIRLFNGATGPSIETRISLSGFTEAYDDYLERIDR